MVLTRCAVCCRCPGDQHGAPDGDQLRLLRHRPLVAAGPERAERRHDHAHDGAQLSQREPAVQDRPGGAQDRGRGL